MKPNILETIYNDFLNHSIYLKDENYTNFYNNNGYNKTVFLMFVYTFNKIIDEKYNIYNDVLKKFNLYNMGNLDLNKFFTEFNNYMINRFGETEYKKILYKWYKHKGYDLIQYQNNLLYNRKTIENFILNVLKPYKEKPSKLKILPNY